MRRGKGGRRKSSRSGGGKVELRSGSGRGKSNAYSFRPDPKHRSSEQTEKLRLSFTALPRFTARSLALSRLGARQPQILTKVHSHVDSSICPLSYRVGMDLDLSTHINRQSSFESNERRTHPLQPNLLSRPHLLVHGDSFLSSAY